MKRINLNTFSTSENLHDIVKWCSHTSLIEWCHKKNGWKTYSANQHTLYSRHNRTCGWWIYLAVVLFYAATLGQSDSCYILSLCYSQSQGIIIYRPHRQWIISTKCHLGNNMFMNLKTLLKKDVSVMDKFGQHEKMLTSLDRSYAPVTHPAQNCFHACICSWYDCKIVNFLTSAYVHMTVRISPQPLLEVT